MSGGYIFIPSIIAAALFWQVASNTITNLNFQFTSQFQQYAADAFFAILLLVIVVPLGRILSGTTETLHVDKLIISGGDDA